MPSRTAIRAQVRFHVTPRFEIFYALRALGETSDRTAEWRRGTEQLLPAKLYQKINDIATRPMIWALLADTLRDARPDPPFAEVIRAIESLTDEAFQRAILAGVFRSDGTVETLMSRDLSLADAVKGEMRSGNALVSLLGLHPYNKSNPVVVAFNRVIAEPASYQSDLVLALNEFWSCAFRESWTELEPRMERLV